MHNMQMQVIIQCATHSIGETLQSHYILCLENEFECTYICGKPMKNASNIFASLNEFLLGISMLIQIPSHSRTITLTSFNDMYSAHPLTRTHVSN